MRGSAKKVYSVAEENGKKFIRALDKKDLSRQIFLNFNWEVKKRPILSWRWRPVIIPKGANESDGNTNDSACGIYVIIGKYSGHAIKYVWSTSLKSGTVVSRHDGKLKIKVLDSGIVGLGKWKTHRVNVISDYKELFGKELKKNPSGIGILTDGNAVHATAACDYSNFTILNEGDK